MDFAESNCGFMLEEIELPEGVDFYSVDGQVLFNIRGEGGGITTKYICYLVSEVGEKFFVFGIIFDMRETKEEIKKKVEEGATKFIEKLALGTAREVDRDGGDLGLGD